MGEADDDEVPGGERPQDPLDVGDVNGGTGGGDAPFAPVDVDETVGDLAAVTDGGPAVVGAQLEVGLEVALADEGGADPQLPVPRLHLHAGEGTQRIGVLAPGDEGELRGAVVVAQPTTGGVDAVPGGGVDAVAGDDDVPPGEVRAGGEQMAQRGGGEVGVGGVREVVDEAGACPPGVHCRTEIHRRGHRAGDPDPAVLRRAGELAEGGEGPRPGVRAAHDGAGSAGGAGRGEGDAAPPSLRVGEGRDWVIRREHVDGLRRGHPHAPHAANG